MPEQVSAELALWGQACGFVFMVATLAGYAIGPAPWRWTRGKVQSMIDRIK
jgi:hypothetical protein